VLSSSRGALDCKKAIRPSSSSAFTAFTLFIPRHHHQQQQGQLQQQGQQRPHTEPDTTSNTLGLQQPSGTDRSDGATSNDTLSNHTGGSTMQSAGPTGPAPLPPIGHAGPAGLGQPPLPIHLENLAAAAEHLPDVAHLLPSHLPPGAIPGPLLHFLRTFPQTILEGQQLQQQHRPGSPAVLGPGGVLGPASSGTLRAAAHRAAALARYLEKKKSRSYHKKVRGVAGWGGPPGGGRAGRRSKARAPPGPGCPLLLLRPAPAPARSARRAAPGRIWRLAA
jgi:hypothetical protein